MLFKQNSGPLWSVLGKVIKHNNHYETPNPYNLRPLLYRAGYAVCGRTMILPLLITIALICANVYNAPPALYNTAQVAEWANCEPERVSYWIGQRIEYIEVKGWESANDCIERGYGDCKCMSIIARDVMKHCGYDSSVVTLHRSPLGSSAAHAIAVFAKGKTKGYINGSTTTFSEDLATVPGGPWN